MNFQIISNVIDKYFEFMHEIGANRHLSRCIPAAMKDGSNKFAVEEWMGWHPIPSTITTEDIFTLEQRIGYELPSSYKYFLQHKHFLELNLGDQPINFFRSLPGKSVDGLLQQIRNFPPSLIDMELDPPLVRGYIPFGDFSDYGMACFDATSSPVIANEYRIIWLDHEDGYQEPQFVSPNFLTLFREFSIHLDEWIKTNGNENSLE